METKYVLVGIDAAIKITMDNIRAQERSNRLERLRQISTMNHGNVGCDCK